MSAEGLHVQIDQFQGPLDLLLHLIKEQEIDVEEISVADITDQYIDYLKKQTANAEQMSEFLVMAAQLLALKAKAILPPEKVQEEVDADETELNTRQQLIERLLEYQQFKKAAELLAEWEKEWQAIVPGPTRGDENDAPPPSAEFTNLNLENVLRALHHVLQSKTVTVHRVIREPVTIEERMEQLTERLRVQPRIDFVDIFSGDATRRDVIVTFLALLELSRSGLLRFETLPEDPTRFYIVLQEESLNQHDSA